MPIGKVWICRLLFLFVCFLCVCMVTDFSGEDKASGVKFNGGSSAPCAGNLQFWGTLLPRKPKIGRIGVWRQVFPIDASPLHWCRAALRLVRARVLCQMWAPYRPITSLPLPPIAGPQNCEPGCCSTPSTPLNAALLTDGTLTVSGGDWRLGMYGYTVVPDDGHTCFILTYCEQISLFISCVNF